MNKDLQISVAKVAARSVCRDDVQSTVAHDLHSSTLSILDMSQKTVQISFCQHFVKFPPILIIFYRKMAKRLELCEMHSFSTSLNSRHHTTVLNADVRNCYTTLKVVICSKLSDDLISTQWHSKVKCGLFSRIISSYNSSIQNCQN